MASATDADEIDESWIPPVFAVRWKAMGFTTLGVVWFVAIARLMFVDADAGGSGAILSEDVGVLELRRQVERLTVENRDQARRIQTLWIANRNGQQCTTETEQATRLTTENKDQARRLQMLWIANRNGQQCATEAEQVERLTAENRDQAKRLQMRPVPPPVASRSDSWRGEGSRGRVPSDTLQRVYENLWAEVGATGASLSKAYVSLVAEGYAPDALQAMFQDVYRLSTSRFAAACATLHEAFGWLAGSEGRANAAAALKQLNKEILAQLKSEANLQETYAAVAARLASKQLQEEQAVIGALLGLGALASLAVFWSGLAVSAQMLAFSLYFRMFFVKLAAAASLWSFLVLAVFGYFAYRCTRWVFALTLRSAVSAVFRAGIREAAFEVLRDEGFVKGVAEAALVSERKSGL